MAAGREPGTCAVGYAADDDAAAITADIIAQTGFVPIRVGTLAQSGHRSRRSAIPSRVRNLHLIRRATDPRQGMITL